MTYQGTPNPILTRIYPNTKGNYDRAYSLSKLLRREGEREVLRGGALGRVEGGEVKGRKREGKGQMGRGQVGGRLGGKIPKEQTSVLGCQWQSYILYRAEGKPLCVCALGTLP